MPHAFAPTPAAVVLESTPPRKGSVRARSPESLARSERGRCLCVPKRAVREATAPLGAGAKQTHMEKIGSLKLRRCRLTASTCFRLEAGASDASLLFPRSRRHRVLRHRGDGASDIYTAQAEAIHLSGALLRDIGAKFWNSTEWSLEVADERGCALFVLRFSAEERSAMPDAAPIPGAP